MVLVIPMPEKKVQECCSSLHPSEKELLERHSITKIPLGVSILISCHFIMIDLLQESKSVCSSVLLLREMFGSILILGWKHTEVHT
jgi:hypothetical protein